MLPYVFRTDGGCHLYLYFSSEDKARCFARDYSLVFGY